MTERSQHDEYFKALMVQPGTAGTLLRERLPRALAALLEPGEPELLPGSYVDPELRQSHSDLLFRMALRGGGSLYVYCLVEHKSSPDPRIGWQLLRYLTRIWERLDRKNKRRGKLPPIVPLVVYHGREKWSAPKRFTVMVDAPPEMLPVLLDFPYGFVDLHTMDEQALSKNVVLRVGLLVLKYAMVEFESAPIDLVAGFLSELRKAGCSEEFLVQVASYIWRAYEAMDKGSVVEAARRAMPEKEDEMVSIFARELLAEGEAKGLAKGRAEGRAEGRVEGRAEGMAGALVRILEARFGRVPERHQKAIASGALEDLQVWLDRAATAQALEDVFATPTP
ncbi:MAG: Rpn family recombination-promoting nuclease/putative transposase [Myxococcales bacterium]